MRKIGVIVAMDKELELFAGQVANFQTRTVAGRTFYCGNRQNKNITATTSGIGKVNAALCAADLLRSARPDILLNLGISGGLDTSLNIGDFIIGTEIVYHDVWCGEPNAYGQIQNFPARYRSAPKLTIRLPQYKRGLICCGDKFITENSERRLIKSLFPAALAVDMESAAIAQTCYLYHTPFLCIRQISDTPGKHQAEQYDKFWQTAAQNSFAVLTDILERL